MIFDLIYILFMGPKKFGWKLGEEESKTEQNPWTTYGS